MRLNLHEQIEISSLSAVVTRRAFPSDTDTSPILNAWRNLDIDSANVCSGPGSTTGWTKFSTLSACSPARWTRDWFRQLDASAYPGQHFTKGQSHSGLEILALNREPFKRSASSALRAPASSSENIFEEIAIILAFVLR